MTDNDSHTISGYHRCQTSNILDIAGGIHRLGPPSTAGTLHTAQFVYNLICQFIHLLPWWVLAKQSATQG